MTNDQANALIELAVGQGCIAPFQADQLKEELFMFPGSNVLSLMIRRGMITSDQARSLEAGPSETPAPSVDETDMDFGQTQHSAPQIRPSTPSPDSNGSFRVVSPTPTPLRNTGSAVHQVDRPHVTTQAPPAAAVERSRRSVSDAIGIARSVLTNQSTPTASKELAAPDGELARLLQIGRERGCSDLHLTVGKPPYFRQEGKLLLLQEKPLTAEATHKLAWSVLNSEQRSEYGQNHQVDFSFEYPGLGRYRANVYRQRNGMEAAFRFIPEVVPTLESIKAPAVLEKLTTFPQGLNLVTGPGGCGKTTTVAAMLEYINCHRHDHIITVEDPVEYVFKPKNCQITQREVGTHTNSFGLALRTALRQDPDVIMIGELRDLETTSISITAAETGHLVFGTLHTSSAVRTVARILDVYPPSQRAQICMMVAESLRGIISQQLLPRRDGKGRACAMEILIVTTGVSQVIKEGKTHQLVSHMQSGRKLGMKSMDDALMDLCKTGIISGSVAWSAADNKSLFEMVRAEE